MSKNTGTAKKSKINIGRLRFSNLNIGTKLIFGFLVVIVLTGIVGFVGIKGFSSISSANNTVADSSGITKDALNCSTLVQNYIDVSYGTAEAGVPAINAVHAKLADMQQKVDQIKNNVSDTRSTESLKNMSAQLVSYQEAFDKFADASKASMAILYKTSDFSNTIAKNLIDAKNEIGQFDQTYAQVDTIDTDYANNRTMFVSYIRNPADSNWTSLDATIKKTTASVGTLLELTKSDTKLYPMAQSISTALASFAAQMLEYKNLAANQKDCRATMVECENKVIGSSDPSNPYYGGAELFNSIATDKASSSKSSAQMLMIIFIGGTIVLGLAIAYVLQRGISKPINSVKMALQKMAVGDLGADVKVNSTDEVGQMAQSYMDMKTYMNEMATAADCLANGDLTAEVKPKSSEDSLGNAFQKMIVNLRDLIQQVQGNAIKLNEASFQLSKAADEAGKATQGIAVTSQQLAKGAGEQAQKVQEVTKAVGELSSAVVQIAQGSQEQSKSMEQASAIVGQVSKVISNVSLNAQNANKSSNEANEAAKIGMDAVNKTVQGMGKIKTSMDTVAGKITKLGERSDEIGKIVNVIEDIAAQTNLLALNAAIEAARAGDQGRGFAVVADEVRKLADRVAAATKEISNLIDTVRSGATDCIKATEEGSKEVDEGYRLADDAGKALKHILDSAEGVSKQIHQISLAAEEVRTSADQMVKTIDNVSKVVEQNSAATQQMSANSDQVAKSVEGIAGITEQNSAATEESSASAEEMSAQVQEVVASSQSLSNMAKTLQQAVIVFKVSTNGAKDKSEILKN